MVKDVKTLDEMTAMAFRDFTAKMCWNSLIEIEYRNSETAKSTMDFARRWSKIILYMMHNDGIAFSDAIIPAAREANIDNASEHERRAALELLIAVWSEGDNLLHWANNPDNISKLISLN